VTSLPGAAGAGDLGPGAIAFLDWLVAAGQGVWQVLPLAPPGYGGSPYTSTSAFALHPLFLSVDRLVEDGWLAAEEAQGLRPARGRGGDFAAAVALRERAARAALARLDRERPPERLADFERFLAAPEQATWLADWALFRALKRRAGERPWWEWPAELARREAAALARARTELAVETRCECFLQWLLERQWQALAAAARERRIEILGDLPLYLARDAADVWARPELFDLDPEGRPLNVAGVPPDYFSADGQLWGNPLYRWERHAAEGFAWWHARLTSNLARTPRLRLDHFRGFEAFWEVPAGAPTARTGRWVKGPGAAPFAALRGDGSSLPLVAEDLGVITPEVDRLRAELGIPGTKVLQFGFLPEASDHLPHRLRPDTAIYTGTHDNDTARGWYAKLDPASKRRFRDYLGSDGKHAARDLARAAATSVAELAIVAMQDALELPSAARMNTPGRDRGNWRWRLEREDLADAPARRLRRLAELSGRLP
jgi:4-alpha-glucanotransferase